jgi:hypothetical protein
MDDYVAEDARAAKAKFKVSGKILWPVDLRARDGQPETVTHRRAGQQHELRI